VPDQDAMKVTCVYFQEFSGLSSPTPDTPVQHAFGKTELREELSGCAFQISPGAFFQVNTIGAEMMYANVMEKVKQVSDNPNNTLLFDVCCGTGTIGIACMKASIVGHVIGVDLSEPAIHDARKNAKLNGFNDESKVRFVAARAEDVLHKEIKKAKADTPDLKFVAVVDPARDGLHQDVVRTLRQNTRISRIV
jgi:tRNA (uracil-5-)-methyltransferase